MANIPLTNFNAGELTPQISERIDTEKHQSGCKVMENFIPRIYGGAERRPGTYYITTSYKMGQNVRLMPFVYSSSIAYLVECGDEYMRFFYDDEVVVTIETPFSTEDNFQIHYQQIADVMRIVHSSHHIKTLSRTSAVTFELADMDFKNGPFLTRNDLLDPDDPDPAEMECSVTEVGESGILTAKTDVFYEGHEGALFKLIHPVETTSVSQSGAGTSASVYVTKNGGYFSTQGTWQGTIKLQRSEDDENWEDFRTYTALASGARNDSYTIKPEDTGAYFRIYASHSSCGATLTTWDVLQAGIVKITTVSGGKYAICEVISKLSSTDATKRWAEGAWSGYRGYPSTITFFENRSCFAGGISNSDRNSDIIPAYPVLQGEP
jgi:hypothetical protein